MAYFNADSGELTDDEAHQHSSADVPTGMDNDPGADEEVINQDTDGSSSEKQYPKPVDESNQSGEVEQTKLTSDNLADSIAYALDGSGPGLTNDTPNVPGGHKVITEGTTGAGLDEEEDNLRSLL